MENYLRFFDTEADYESVKDEFEYPTVSYTNDTAKVWYMVKTPSLYEWVDLGLSVKWAAWNVGATKPEEFGLYFAWGETQGYSEKTPEKQFTWNDYTLCSSQSNMLKYNGTDKLKTLEPTDDAATVSDGSCRIPTKSELQELIDNTTSEWVNDYNGTGVAGRIFTSNVNGKSFFIPAMGNIGNTNQNGMLWSSSLDNMSSMQAYYLMFNSNSVSIPVYGSRRYMGMLIRPVR